MRAVVLACAIVAAAVTALLGAAVWIEVSRTREASVAPTDLAALVDAPASYDGMRLTVEAPIGAVLRRNALVLGAKDPARGLVVVAPGRARFEEGTVVRATGNIEVRPTGPVLLATAVSAREG